MIDKPYNTYDYSKAVDSGAWKWFDEKNNGLVDKPYDAYDYSKAVDSGAWKWFDDNANIIEKTDSIASRLGSKYGDDIANLVRENPELAGDVDSFVTKYGHDAAELISKYGETVLNAFKNIERFSDNPSKVIAELNELSNVKGAKNLLEGINAAPSKARYLGQELHVDQAAKLKNMGEDINLEEPISTTAKNTKIDIDTENTMYEVKSWSKETLENPERQRALIDQTRKYLQEALKSGKNFKIISKEEVPLEVKNILARELSEELGKLGWSINDIILKPF